MLKARRWATILRIGDMMIYVREECVCDFLLCDVERRVCCVYRMSRDEDDGEEEMIVELSCLYVQSC